MSNDRELISSPVHTGPRPISPNPGPNRAARRELARESRLDRKRLRKAVQFLDRRMGR